MTTQQQLECCICMDSIVNTRVNCVTTECGHTFHTNCLMANVSHNGFGCPYCRQVMAEEREEEDNNENDDESTLSYFESVNEVELYDDEALRGMRWLFQMAENGGVGEEAEADEDEEEADEDEEEADEDEEEVEELPPRPSISFIAKKLLERGTTFEDFVKSYIGGFDEYDDMRRECYKVDTKIYDKIDAIIKRYRPEQEEQTTN